jgi:hypothetical protein
MTLIDLFDYFETYAVANKALNHVIDDDKNTAFIASNTQDDIDEIIKKCARELIMVFLPYDKKMLPVKAENFNWGKASCFLIIKKCSRANARAIITAQSECEEIANDFVRQLIADRLIKITSVELDSFYMEPVGPISDGRYGYICMYNLTDEFDHEHKPERWKA